MSVPGSSGVRLHQNQHRSKKQAKATLKQEASGMRDEGGGIAWAVKTADAEEPQRVPPPGDSDDPKIETRNNPW